MSDVARRRLAALLLVAGIAVAALAITNRGPFGESPPNSEEAVVERVEDLYAAAAQGDFTRFCALLTPRARATLRRNANRLTGEDVGCVTALELTLGEGLEGARATVEDASVSGPRARVTTRFHAPDEEPELRTVYLEEIDGQWLVSDPG